MTLCEAIRRADARAIGRGLSVLERGGAAAEELVRALRGHPNQARTVGITGAPGVGKSTLVEVLGLELLRLGERAAVLAVDPSSPFSGGALLGDRLRMPDFVAAGGFVRSMATRGALGGLAAATADALDLLAAAGFSSILVETVGVGQDEVDIAGVVESVVVVTVAGMGDEVQTAKAGILEIADVLVVNKSDLPGTEHQIAALREMLELRPPSPWRLPLVVTCAKSSEGVSELLEAIEEHKGFLARDERRTELRRSQAARRLNSVLWSLVRERVCREDEPAYLQAVEAVARGTVDPYSAARALLMVLEEREA